MMMMVMMMVMVIHEFFLPSSTFSMSGSFRLYVRALAIFPVKSFLQSPFKSSEQVFNVPKNFNPAAVLSIPTAGYCACACSYAAAALP